MNLEEALYELTKNPVSMIAGDGHAYPAIRYTSKTHRALNWLVERYNDGTLKIEGYTPTRTPIARRRKRKGTEIMNGRYVSLGEFIKQSGFTYKETIAIGKRADAYIPQDRKGNHSYIDVEKFYDFLTEEGRLNNKENYVSLMDAVKITGIPAREIREQIKKGVIKEEPYVKYSHFAHKIHYDSLRRYAEKKKGEKHGKNNTNNG